MNVPETYEDFLRTPKEELLKITDHSLKNEEVTRIISFCRKFREEKKNKIISESKNKKCNTLYEELYEIK